MKFTKRIVLSVLTLVITVFALGTGVFAWFTINNTASASNLSGKVQAGTGGFLISYNGSEWNTTVNLKDVPVKGSSTLTDLTSTDGKTFTKHGVQTGVTEGFIEFELDFLVGSEFTKINLSDLTIVSDETKWKSDVNVTLDGTPYAVGQEIANYASNAARVSIEGNGTNEMKVFEQGDVNGNTSDIATSETNKAFTYYNTVNPSNKLTYPTSSPIADLVKASSEKTKMETTEVSTLDDRTETTDSYYKDGYTKEAKITVRVWIEGWDGEAFNAILGGKLDINFVFTAE